MNSLRFKLCIFRQQTCRAISTSEETYILCGRPRLGGHKATPLQHKITGIAEEPNALPLAVIPTKAGIYCFPEKWIPAYAGMTISSNL